MKLASRCIPTGSLPYEKIETATRMVAKLFDRLPYCPVMNAISTEDSIINRTLAGIPGIVIKNNKVSLKNPEKCKNELKMLDKAYNSPTKENLAPFGFDATFQEKFLQMIKKFKSPNACINLLGPFTLSQMIMNAAEEQNLTEKSFRKLFIQVICVKALWMIEKMKEYCPNTVPLVMLEEPMLCKLGEVKRENEDITIDIVVGFFSKVVEKLHEAGAIVGVQSMEKCDWKVPINAGVDLIFFDAYNNPNNLNIMPETIIDFVSRGGKICWGIVPTTSESIVKALSIDYVRNRLLSTLDGLVMSGVPEPFVYNSALVSIQGDVGHLPIIFAEKAIILSTQLAKKIPVKS